MSTLREAIAALVDEPGMDVCSCQACASTLESFTIAIYRAGVLRGREESAQVAGAEASTEWADSEHQAAEGNDDEAGCAEEGAMAAERIVKAIRALPAPTPTLDDEVPT